VILHKCWKEQKVWHEVKEIRLGADDLFITPGLKLLAPRIPPQAVMNGRRKDEGGRLGERERLTSFNGVLHGGQR
jgi:hypothetical protein